MSPTKFRLKRQKSTPKRQKSPRTPKQKVFKSPVTPVTVASSGNSPQFPWQSQEAHDGVTWDYRSPMQQKLRSARRHGKATVTELLTFINHGVEKQQKTSLLDTWISAEPSMASPVHCCTRESRESRRRRASRPRHLAKELQELSEAISKKDDDKGSEEETRLLHSSPHFRENGSFNSDTANKFCAVNSIDTLDSSSDELWGADSDSFLIQATQAIEQAEDEYVNKQLSQTAKVLVSDINKEFLPSNHDASDRGTKTVTSSVSAEKCHKENKNVRDLHTAGSSDNNKNVVCQVDLAENFWESDNSFDEILSSLPYDELAEKTGVNANAKTVSLNNCSLNKHSAIQTSYNSSKSVSSVPENKLKRPHQDKLNHERNKTDNKTRCLIISDKNSSLFTAVSSMNLQADTIDWESDEFDAVVMQTEILMALEQAESQALGSQKCTPEEIEKKKAEALKRRKHKNLNVQTVTQKTGKQKMMWKDRLRSKVIKNC